jgi:hypothetical protein
MLGDILVGNLLLSLDVPQVDLGDGYPVADQ